LGLYMYAKPDVVQRFDSKINFKHLCREVGVPVVEYAIFKTRQGVHELVQLIKMMSNKTGKVIVRGEYGASASTTYVLDRLDYSLINEIVASSKPEDRYLVEPFYKTLSSPSSVWFITKIRTIVLLRTSNQLLEEGISHAGNEFPVQFAEEQVNRYSFRIAKRLAEEGFLGPFGIDYIETEKGLYATECNPRVTGAMYPWELVSILEKKGSIKAARSENIHLPRKGLTFEALKKLWKNVLYNGHNGKGIIVPYNVGPISEGKVTVLGTGSSKKEVDSLFKNIKSRLINLI
ncbi:MAG: ATP-grasp domain-containing protein, partial [Candidatus Heimdallarchaeota archaeon]